MISPVKPGARLDLRKVDPDQPELYPKGKEASQAAIAELQEQLAQLQERFYVARRYKLLVVLQGMDTSGKSGTLRTVFRAANPQGVTVAVLDSGYDPGHPDADKDGYVAMPRVNPAEDMVDLLGASRGYQANVAAISAVKDMIHRSLDLLR